MARITEEEVDYMVENAARIDFHRFPETTVTVCMVLLENGCTILGRSSCIHMDDFNQATGEDVAVRDAKDKLWELESYHKKANLADG